MSDPSTTAFIAASDAQMFKDISTAANAATMVSPGRAIPYALGVGAAASFGSAVTGSSPPLDEILKYGSQEGATKFFQFVLGYPPVAAARAVAAIDLTGGWDAFVNRVKVDVIGIKPIPVGGAK